MKFNKSTSFCLIALFLFVSFFYSPKGHTEKEFDSNKTVNLDEIKEDVDKEQAIKALKREIDQGIKDIRKEYAKKFRDELKKAEQILDDKTVSTETVNEQVERLKSLRASYRENKDTKPKTPSDEFKVLKAELRKRVDEEINLENYTENSAVDYINSKKYARDILDYAYASSDDLKEAIRDYDKSKKSLVEVKKIKASKSSMEALLKLFKIAKTLDLNKVSNSGSKSSVEKMIASVDKLLADKKVITEDIVRISYKNLGVAMTRVLHGTKNTKGFSDENLIKALQRMQRLDMPRLSQESVEQLYSIYEYGIESYDVANDQKTFDARTKKVNLVIDNLAYVKKKLPIAGVEKGSLIIALSSLFLVIGFYCATKKVTN